MEKITLKNSKNELEITKLAFGHSDITNPDRRALFFRLMDKYIDLGGNCLDTARLYCGGEAEKLLSTYIKGARREKIVLITKCGHYDRQAMLPVSRVNAADIISDFETSLKELETDYVDILFLHRDDIKRPVEEIMPTLDRFVREGKARILGASNWTAGRIQAANKFAAENGLTPFSVSQIHHSLGLTTPGQSNDYTHVVMDNIEYYWYKSQKFPVMSWSASAHGFFSNYASGNPIKETPMHRYGWLDENIERAKRAKKLADELNAPVGAVVLAYLMCDEAVQTCPVTTFSSENQFNEAIAATDLKLTRAQVDFLING